MEDREVEPVSFFCTLRACRHATRGTHNTRLARFPPRRELCFVCSQQSVTGLALAKDGIAEDDASFCLDCQVGHDLLLGQMIRSR